MKIPAGTCEPWPKQPFRISQGELLLVSKGDNDFAFFRLERSIVFPGFPTPEDNGIQLYLSAIDDGLIEQINDAEILALDPSRSIDDEGRRWLEDRLSREQQPSDGAP